MSRANLKLSESGHRIASVVFGKRDVKLSRSREVSRGQSIGFRLGKNFAPNHIRRPNVSLIVTHGYVLNDRTSAAVRRIRPHDGPFLGEYGVHLTDDFAIIITDQHLLLLWVEISALRSRRRTVP